MTGGGAAQRSKREAAMVLAEWERDDPDGVRIIRDHIADLRREAADYRTRLRAAEQTAATG